MKKQKLFFVVLGALLLSSCDRDVVVQDSIPAKLTLSITGTNVDTRSSALPLPSQAEENTVNRVTIGLFKSSGAIDVIKEILLADLTTINASAYQTTIQGSIIGTESGARDIIVVANAPANYFAGLTTKFAFINKALSLTQVRNNLPMSGTGTTTLIANQTVGPVTVPISRMVARVDLVSLSSAFDPAGQYANASFVADEIFMYNAMSTSTVDCATTLFPKDGWLQTPIPTPPILYDASLRDPINQPFTGSTAYSTKHYFYTFANLFMANLGNATNIGGPFDVATRLVISGMFKTNPSDSEERVYYPVIINRLLPPAIPADPLGIGVKRNTIYQITATIKSKGGVTPLTIIDPAYLGVKIEVLDWALIVPQNAEF